MCYSVINSRFSHPISSAIFANVCRSGWCMLVHHLLTVTAETPNCSASHLLVFWFSTRTTFSRLRGFSLIFIKLKSSANIIKVSDITKRILKKLHYLPSLSLPPPLQRRTIYESSTNHLRAFDQLFLPYPHTIRTIALQYKKTKGRVKEHQRSTPSHLRTIYVTTPSLAPSLSLPSPFHIPCYHIPYPGYAKCHLCGIVVSIGNH